LTHDTSPDRRMVAHRGQPRGLGFPQQSL